MRKFEISNGLIRRYGYRSYLEICTPITGGTFRRIHAAGLDRCHRLVYLCPLDFAGGGAITFRSPDEHIEGLLPPGAQYDMVFVDAWHTERCAARDLRYAFSLLAPGGIMLVHDCSPPTAEITAPEFVPGPWCGVTYCVFVDFLCRQPGLDYCVVDTDYGCGIVRKTPRGDDARALAEPALFERWRRTRAARGLDVFDFFTQHRRELLNLVSVDDFLAAEAIPGPAVLLQVARRLRGWERVERRLHALLFAH